MMIAKPATKYQGIAPINLPDRQWPSCTIARAPIWLSTDLRDGNQALFEPMNGERKMKLFHELVRIGFKEIEVGFPAASQTDFDFVRRLIDEDLIPEDVTLMVMTQSREDLIALLRSDEAEEMGRAVDLHISRLRRKIQDQTDRELIRTYRGMGYMLDAKVTVE